MIRALLMLLAVGCAVPVDRAATTGVFPHPDDYATGTHGPDALAEGAACASCHAVEVDDTVQGATPSAPACHSCHAEFPHVAGYGTSPTHGADWKTEGADCADCHGTDGTEAPGESSSGRCVSCHASYPHPSGWELPAGHGAAVLERKNAGACLTCHDDGGPADAACAACHPAYPHPDGWALPTGHGVAYEAQVSCGEGCHPADPADVAPRLACKTCHDLFPHPDGWPEGHIAVVQARGEAACTVCHAPGTLDGGKMPVSCGASCHEGSP